MDLIEHQKREITDNNYPYEMVDLSENLEGEIVVKRTSKPPITTFPIKLNAEDKTGSIVIWEMPDKGIEFGTYLASIDPVSEGKTKTSDSLCSIYVCKTATKVTRYT